jgi:hypothetical protein
MGTERSEYIRQPCFCGQGEFAVNYCTPDHPFAPPEAHSWELLIECDSCEKEYAFIQQDNQAVVVRLCDIEERKRIEREYFQKVEELEKSEEVQNYFRDFEALIADQPSAAAKHRLFVSSRVLTSAIGTFRRELKSLGDIRLFRKFVSLYNLPDILPLLAKQDQSLLERMSELRKLYAKSQEPCPPVIEPLCVLTREAYYKS